MKAYAAANPDARWILGRGWNQELWADKRFPTAADIDAVVSDRPVWLGRVDGHAAIANSAAMQAAGFALNTQAPSGGRIENGLFVDAAMSLIESKIPAPTPAEQDAALAAVQRMMLSNGLTAAADMGTTPDEWAAMNRAGEAGTLNVRIMSYAGGIPGDAGDQRRQAQRLAVRRPAAPRRGQALRRRRARIARRLAEAALCRQAGHTRPAIPDRRADSRAGQCRGSGRLPAGDPRHRRRRQRPGHLDLREAGRDLSAGDRRWRIEHFQIADPADIPRLKPAGIIASMQPTHQTSDRLMAEARLGPDRLKGAYAWQTVEKLGVPIAFGSDFPVESPNPFPGLAAAVSRQDMNGQPPGGWLPEERVSFEQALAGFTRGAAYAGFAEDKIGSLEPGKWADFILVDRDVSKVDPQALARTQVLETWVAGKKVWEGSSRHARSRGDASSPILASPSPERRRRPLTSIPGVRICGSSSGSPGRARTTDRAARRPGPGFRGSA